MPSATPPSGVDVGRPKTPIEAYGAINVRRRGSSMVAETRFRDFDGRLRQVRVAGPTNAAARHRLKERLADRREHNGGRSLRSSNGFADLAKLWLADLEVRGLAEGTRQNYRDGLRLHVLPAFERYTLASLSAWTAAVVSATSTLARPLSVSVRQAW